MDNAVYTIGHSNHLPDTFIWLLTEAKIEVLVDVRSNPVSPWACLPQRQITVDEETQGMARQAAQSGLPPVL